MKPPYGLAIVVKRTGEEGGAFPLMNQTTFIGRDADCHIRLRPLDVSKCHAAIDIDVDTGDAYIIDKSTNGTGINGIQVISRQLLMHRDIINIGDRKFRFEYSEDHRNGTQTPLTANKENYKSDVFGGHRLQKPLESTIHKSSTALDPNSLVHSAHVNTCRTLFPPPMSDSVPTQKAIIGKEKELPVAFSSCDSPAEKKPQTTSKVTIKVVSSASTQLNNLPLDGALSIAESTCQTEDQGSTGNLATTIAMHTSGLEHVQSDVVPLGNKSISMLSSTMHKTVEVESLVHTLESPSRHNGASPDSPHTNTRSKGPAKTLLKKAQEKNALNAANPFIEMSDGPFFDSTLPTLAQSGIDSVDSKLQVNLSAVSATPAQTTLDPIQNGSSRLLTTNKSTASTRYTPGPLSGRRGTPSNSSWPSSVKLAKHTPRTPGTPTTSAPTAHAIAVGSPSIKAAANFKRMALAPPEHTSAVKTPKLHGALSAPLSARSSSMPLPILTTDTNSLLPLQAKAASSTPDRVRTETSRCESSLKYKKAGTHVRSVSSNPFTLSASCGPVHAVDSPNTSLTSSIFWRELDKFVATAKPNTKPVSHSIVPSATKVSSSTLDENSSAKTPTKGNTVSGVILPVPVDVTTPVRVAPRGSASKSAPMIRTPVLPPVVVKATTLKKLRNVPPSTLTDKFLYHRTPYTSKVDESETKSTGNPSAIMTMAEPVFMDSQNNATSSVAGLTSDNLQMMSSPSTPKCTPSTSSGHSNVVSKSAFKRGVRFGPSLDPEIFDRWNPPSTPIKRGEKVQVHNAGSTISSVLKGALRRLDVGSTGPDISSILSSPLVSSQLRDDSMLMDLSHDSLSLFGPAVASSTPNGASSVHDIPVAQSTTPVVVPIRSDADVDPSTPTTREQVIAECQLLSTDSLGAFFAEQSPCGMHVNETSCAAQSVLPDVPVEITGADDALPLSPVAALSTSPSPELDTIQISPNDSNIASGSNNCVPENNSIAEMDIEKLAEDTSILHFNVLTASAIDIPDEELTHMDIGLNDAVASESISGHDLEAGTDQAACVDTVQSPIVHSVDSIKPLVFEALDQISDSHSQPDITKSGSNDCEVGVDMHDGDRLSQHDSSHLLTPIAHTPAKDTLIESDKDNDEVVDKSNVHSVSPVNSIAGNGTMAAISVSKSKATPNKSVSKANAAHAKNSKKGVSKANAAHAKNSKKAPTTPNMQGFSTLFKTPKAAFDIDMDGLKELLKTPCSSAGPIEVESLLGLESPLVVSSDSCASPSQVSINVESDSTEAMAHDFDTPSRCLLSRACTPKPIATIAVSNDIPIAIMPSVAVSSITLDPLSSGLDATLHHNPTLAATCGELMTEQEDFSELVTVESLAGADATHMHVAASTEAHISDPTVSLEDLHASHQESLIHATSGFKCSNDADASSFEVALAPGEEPIGDNQIGVEDTMVSDVGVKTPIKRSKTPIKRSKTPVTRSKTPAVGVKTPASGSKTPVERLEISDVGAKTPISGPKTPASGPKTPAAGSKTPVERLEISDVGAKTPASGSKTPVERLEISDVGAKTPISGPKAPIAGPKTPSVGVKTPAAESKTSVERLEISDVGAKTPASGSKTPIAGPKTPASGSKTPVERLEISDVGVKTPASGSKAPVAEPNTPIERLEISDVGVKTPASGPKTPSIGVKTPAAGSKTPVERLEISDVGVKTPASGSKTPVAEPNTPSVGVKTPAAGSKTPVERLEISDVGVKTPASGSKTPVAEPNTPIERLEISDVGVKTPASGPKTPSVGVKTPAAGSKTPVERLEISDVGVKTPASGSKTPVAEPNTPIERLEISDLGAKTLISGPKTPASRSKTPASGSKTPVERLKISDVGSKTPIERLEISDVGAKTPASGSKTPVAEPKTPVERLVISEVGVKTPISGPKTPIAGSKTPASGSKTPVERLEISDVGAKTPIAGPKTPASGSKTPIERLEISDVGAKTPIAGVKTPVGGSKTPVARSKSQSKPHSTQSKIGSTSVEKLSGDPQSARQSGMPFAVGSITPNNLFKKSQSNSCHLTSTNKSRQKISGVAMDGTHVSKPSSTHKSLEMSQSRIPEMFQHMREQKLKQQLSAEAAYLGIRDIMRTPKKRIISAEPDYEGLASLLATPKPQRVADFDVDAIRDLLASPIVVKAQYNAESLDSSPHGRNAVKPHTPVKENTSIATAQEADVMTPASAKQRRRAKRRAALAAASLSKELGTVALPSEILHSDSDHSQALNMNVSSKSRPSLAQSRVSTDDRAATHTLTTLPVKTLSTPIIAPKINAIVSTDNIDLKPIVSPHSMTNVTSESCVESSVPIILTRCDPLSTASPLVSKEQISVAPASTRKSKRRQRKRSISTPLELPVTSALDCPLDEQKPSIPVVSEPSKHVDEVVVIKDTLTEPPVVVPGLRPKRKKGNIPAVASIDDAPTHSTVEQCHSTQKIKLPNPFSTHTNTAVNVADVDHRVPVIDDSEVSVAIDSMKTTKDVVVVKAVRRKKAAAIPDVSLPSESDLQSTWDKLESNNDSVVVKATRRKKQTAPSHVDDDPPPKSESQTSLIEPECNDDIVVVKSTRRRKPISVDHSDPPPVPVIVYDKVNDVTEPLPAKPSARRQRLARSQKAPVLPEEPELSHISEVAEPQAISVEMNLSPKKRGRRPKAKLVAEPEAASMGHESMSEVEVNTTARRGRSKRLKVDAS
ncbi:hypothetical protein BASA62_007760 [Batrachochytrium salamandrivorans]|nr:hypothetical protein BASA62_007760 [Batrachochytrium salamandrivorans]